MSFTETVHALADSASSRQRFCHLKDGKKIALYGAGGAGRNLFSALVAAGYPAALFLDRNAQPGQLVQGCPVFRPDDAAIAAGRADTHVIVSIFNHFIDVAPILDELRAAGWRSVTSMVDIFHVIPELPELYWLTPTRFYADKSGELLATRDMWADEKSRRLYEAFIELRLTGDYHLMPRPEPNQYFPADAPQWRTPLRLIDGGAFDGDTLRTMEELKIAAGAVAAFEPDEKNYEALVRQRHSSYFSKVDVTLWPCGIYGRTTQLRFSSGLGAASRISSGGDQIIQCVAIDDALSAFEPNLIKMDIEGAEYDALTGAAKTIKECRPGLAVCVYHHPDDIWRIPALLKDWDLDYRFYLRSHAFSGFDTVLYAMTS